ncbi:MAG: hypothetical protein ACRC9L_05635 [Brevinema sp.]
MRIMIFLFFVILSTSIHGYPQPQELYNDGLNHYQQGEIGLAAQALKKSLVLNPSLKEARSLYNIIQTEIGGVEISTNTGFTLLLKLVNIFPPQIDSLISGLLFLIATILVGLIILKKIVRKWYYTGIISFLYIFSGTLLIQSYIKYNLFMKDIRIALVDVDIIDQPFEDGKSLARFPEGIEFEALEENEEYVFVRGPGKQQGWARINDIPKLWGNS